MDSHVHIVGNTVAAPLPIVGNAATTRVFDDFQLDANRLPQPYKVRRVVFHETSLEPQSDIFQEIASEEENFGIDTSSSSEHDQ